MAWRTDFPPRWDFSPEGRGRRSRSSWQRRESQNSFCWTSIRRALDPKTAAKVLEISDKIIAEHGLTAMMVTHNMKDAIAHGNRLIMMHEGKIIYDVSGEEKKRLHVSDLLAKFEEASGDEFANDRMMLG